MARGILLTGGNGFIGSHLVDRFKAKGRKVRVLDRAPERYRGEVGGVEYIHADFGNQGLIKEALSGMDYLVHLVSTTLPKSSNDDPAYDIQSNVVDTVRMLECCIESNIKKVVFISSGGMVYGIPRGIPIKEEHPTNPICSYGISKLTIEKYLALFHHLHGLDFTVLRCSNPYGERQNPFGEQGAVTVFLGKLAIGEKIEIWGSGGVVRDYFHIDDLSEAVTRALTYKGDVRTFNIGSGEGLSLNELVETIRNVTGLAPQVVYSPRREIDTDKVVLDVSLAEKVLHWSTSVGIEEGISRTWQWVKDLCEREGVT